MKKYYCHYKDDLPTDLVLAFSTRYSRDRFCAATEATPITRKDVRGHLTPVVGRTEGIGIYRLSEWLPPYKAAKAAGVDGHLLGHIEYNDGVYAGYRGDI